MIAGLAASPVLSPLAKLFPKNVKNLEGKKVDLRFSDTGKPYYYTTFLFGHDALVSPNIHYRDVTHWVWDYNLQEYVIIRKEGV